VKREDETPLSPDARAMLAFGPIAKGFMDDLRERLPPGTHFGIMILVPGPREGRMVGLTTDRNVMAPAIAQWVMGVLDGSENPPA